MLLKWWIFQRFVPRAWIFICQILVWILYAGRPYAYWDQHFNMVCSTVYHSRWTFKIMYALCARPQSATTDDNDSMSNLDQ